MTVYRKSNKNFVSLRYNKRRSFGKRNRNVGHNYERKWASIWREIGYDKCKTTRQVSRLLDSCKVDLAFIPYNFQCKSVKAPINYTELFDSIDALLKENFPEDDRQLTYPPVIAHKRSTTDEFIIMRPQDFVKLAIKIKAYDDLNNAKKSNEIT